MVVRGQGGGGAGVPGLRTGAQRRGEVQPEVDRVTNLGRHHVNKKSMPVVRLKLNLNEMPLKFALRMELLKSTFDKRNIQRLKLELFREPSKKYHNTLPD